MSIGPEGAREGRAKDHPNQEAFRTSSSLFTSRYWYYGSHWQLERSQQPGVCDLISPSQLTTYFGQPANDGVPANYRGGGGECIWRPRIGTKSRSLLLTVHPTDSLVHAREELDQQLQTTQHDDPNAVHAMPVELPDIGDRGVSLGSFIYILKGQTWYSIGTKQPDFNEEHDALMNLAKSVVPQLPS